MRTFPALLMYLLTPPLVAADLTVRASNAPGEGTLIIQVYDSANSFGDFRDPAVERRCDAVEPGPYAIDGVPDSEIAMLVYHDTNNYGQIDNNFVGIPRSLRGRYRSN